MFGNIVYLLICGNSAKSVYLIVQTPQNVTDRDALSLGPRCTEPWAQMSVLYMCFDNNKPSNFIE